MRAKNIVLDTYRDSYNFYARTRNGFAELYRLAHGQTLHTRKKFNRFIPYIPAAIDLILPRIAGRLPIFDVTGRTEDDEQHAGTMEAVVKYFLEKKRFHDFEVKFIKDAIIFGTSIAQVGWDFRPKSRHPDATTAATRVDEPDFSVIPIESVFPHRRKIDMQDEWPIIIKQEVSRRDLQNDPNIDSKLLSKVGSPIDEREFFSQENKQKDDSQNLVATNPTAESTNDLLTKLTYWGPFDIDGDGKDEECVITVVNYQQVVRLEQNPFWHQQKPFVKLNYTPNAHSFFTEGLVEQNKELQLELNEIRNTRSAARSMALKIPLLVDRGANVNTDTLKWEHSAVWLADFDRNPEPVRPMSVPSKLLEIDREEVAVKSDLQVRSGINDVVIGQNEAGVAGGSTATGASIAAEQTALRFKTQAILIDDAIQQMGDQTISNIQQYVTEETAFQIAGDAGFEWKRYNPDLMRQFNFDFRVSSMSTFVEPKAAKRESLIMLKQLYEGDIRVDQDKLDRMIFEAFDLKPERILKSKEEQARDAAAVELEQLATTVNSGEFDTLPPSEQQALLAQMEQAKAALQQGAQRG